MKRTSRCTGGGRTEPHAGDQDGAGGGVYSKENASSEPVAGLGALFKKT